MVAVGHVAHTSHAHPYGTYGKTRPPYRVVGAWENTPPTREWSPTTTVSRVNHPKVAGRNHPHARRGGRPTTKGLTARKTHTGKKLSEMEIKMAKPKKCGREHRRQMKERDYGFLRHMPPMRLSREDGSFDLFDCDVLEYALEHEGARRRCVNEIRNSGFIEYDKETGTWHGIEYGQDGEEW